MTLLAAKGRGELERALDAADPAVRAYLLYGPDAAASRAFADRLGRALGPDAERVDLAGAVLKTDPARLADEAASFSMFGGRRWIRVEAAGDEVVDAIAALLEGGVAGNPVAILAGELRKDAKLVKLVGGSPAALGFCSYPLEGRDGERMVVEIGALLGLKVPPEIARRLLGACGSDRAIVTRELEKYALFLDADPAEPRPLGPDALYALGAASDEGDLDRLLHAVCGGDSARAAAELGRLGSDVDDVRLMRTMQRRLLLLAELGAEVAAGSAPDVVAKNSRAIFWKDADRVAAELRRWRPADLAVASMRVAEAGRGVMRAGGAGPLAAQTALRLSMQAARRR